MTDLAGDMSQALREQVHDAQARGAPLLIRGGGSKTALVGRYAAGELLSMSEHRGIINYTPQEMVITARAGTPISHVIATAAEHGQMLPFEPPIFSGRATLGGTLASGLSGPARPWRGSMRDAVLGLRLMNGRGEILRFGGEVIKNVAGYDVSRLQAGALGCLGLIMDISLRLVPLPQGQRCFAIPCNAAESIARMRRMSVTALPITGASWCDGVLHFRFEGNRAGLASLSERLDGLQEEDDSYWSALREWELTAQQPSLMPWIIDSAPARAEQADQPAQLIDWGGARRWLPGTVSESRIQLLAGPGGHAMRVGAGEQQEDVFPGPPAALRNLLRRLKASLDPEGIFNAGRLYPWL